MHLKANAFALILTQVCCGVSTPVVKELGNPSGVPC